MFFGLSPRKKQKWQLLTDNNGIGVWPNASTWMWVESIIIIVIIIIIIIIIIHL